MKESGEQRAILQKENAQLFRNRKNTVPMTTVEKFKRHGGGAFFGVEITAGGAETAFTAKRYKF